jgi:hypothetical protein
MIVRGEASDAEIQIVKADPQDTFDQWAKRRDKLLRDERRYRAWGGPFFGPWYPYRGVGFGYYWPYGYYAPRTRVIVRTAHSGRGGHGGRR